MTNMPTEHQFKVFGIVMATVCVPFFLLIGSLNTTSGMEFWQSKWHQFLNWVLRRDQQPTMGSNDSGENPGVSRFHFNLSELD
jgi:hypothetical protein